MINFLTELPHPYNKIGDGPEGPEVRTVADKLQHLTGKVILSHKIGERAKTSGFDSLHTPVTIQSIRSHGKKLIFDLSSSHCIIFSLGMTGRLTYSAGNHSHISFIIGTQRKMTHFTFYTRDLILYFDDYRYMGNVSIISFDQIPAYFSKIGPDLLQHSLTNEIDPITWRQIFRSRKTKREVCAVFLDQDLVSGIGWYLITEILYYAGISPFRTMDTISDDDLELLRQVAHKIIKLSYYYGGFTIESFISPDGTYGSYPAAVYGKKFDQNNYEVRRHKMKNGRMSHYVPELQF